MACAYVLVIFVACSLVTSFSTSSGHRRVLQQHVPRGVSNPNNPDFISIDCEASSTYIDKTISITYHTDEEFTISGKSHGISAEQNSSEQLQTLRSFPDGTKNCYILRPRQGKNNRYLIRVQFKYGNYDGLDKAPQFDMYIGVSKLFTLSTGSSSQEHWIEIINAPCTFYINCQPCKNTSN